MIQIPLLGVYPKKTKTKDMFTESLLTIAYVTTNGNNFGQQ